MEKNKDWKDTYCSPETGNVRYPSTANAAIGGFAYVYTQDVKYVRELTTFHRVQVWNSGRWVDFDGHNLEDREDPEGPPVFEPDAPEDPNW